jgi:DNA-binding MarR family transcriptional regulator
MPATDGHEILRLVNELSRRLTAELHAGLTELDLTPPQAMLLRQVDEPLPMGEAAGQLHCDPSNVTGLVDRLEKRGLIERVPSPSDRRVRHLVLTDEGRHVKQRLDRLMADALALDSLPAGDQAALRDLLQRTLHATRPVEG